MPDPPSISVHLLPALIPPGVLRGGVAVVVDVLRATTVMVHALASGVEAIIPCLEIAEAREAAAKLGPGRAILGGERQGMPIEGFDFGNSPASYTPEVCRGKTLVMTTTNGTRAIHASREADRVLIGAFANLKATLRVCRSSYDAGMPIHVVCAGTDGLVSLEDTLLAGAIVSCMEIAPAGPIANDSAWLAQGAWQLANRSVNYWDQPMEAFDPDSQAGSPEFRTSPGVRRDILSRILSEGRGGGRVAAIGLAPDLRDAADIDRFPEILAEFRRDPPRIVADGPLMLF